MTNYFPIFIFLATENLIIIHRHRNLIIVSFIRLFQQQLVPEEFQRHQFGIIALLLALESNPVQVEVP